MPRLKPKMKSACCAVLLFFACLGHFSSCSRATPAWPQRQIRGEGGAHELYIFGRDALMLRPGTAASEDFAGTTFAFCFPGQAVFREVNNYAAMWLFLCNLPLIYGVY